MTSLTTIASSSFCFSLLFLLFSSFHNVFGVDRANNNNDDVNNTAAADSASTAGAAVTTDDNNPDFIAAVLYDNNIDDDDGAGVTIGWTMIALAFVSSYAAYVVGSLVFPILFPSVIPYPWAMPDVGSRTARRDKERTVVFAGSFNPPHKGHMAMLSYLSQRYGEVIVVVGMNPDKKYDVTPYDRADLLRRMIQSSQSSEQEEEERYEGEKTGLKNNMRTTTASAKAMSAPKQPMTASAANMASNVRVEVVSGYVWRKVRPQGASLFVRGIRTWEKDGKDERSLQILNTWGPLVCGPMWWPIPTMFMEGKPEYNHISSTLVRQICRRNRTGGQQQQQRGVGVGATGVVGKVSAGGAKNDDLSPVHHLKALVPPSIVHDVARLYQS